MKKILISITYIVILSLPSWALASRVEIEASKDNTLYFSDTGSLSNGAGNHFFVGAVGSTGSGDNRRGVIAFDIADTIPSGSLIDSVSLTLRMSRTQIGNRTISLHRLLAAWGEGTSVASGEEGQGATALPGDTTWLHTFSPSEFWSNPGGDFAGTASASISVGGVAFYTWGSTSEMVADVQMWLDDPESNFGWILIGPENSQSSKRFDSRENGTSDFRPVLEINYTPPLFYPHVASDGTWETEIVIINTSDSASLTGTLQAYGDDGQLVESMAVNLAAHGRREINVGTDFGNPNAIGYFILEADSADVRGYTKFFVEGRFRVAVPAVREVNSGDTYVSHIASDAQWWTGVSILNTTGSAKTLTFQFNDGQSSNVTLAAGEHQAFTVASLFGGVAQPTIGSAVITEAAGTVGLELFGSTGAGGESYLSGILLKDDTTSSIYYPHVASDAQWWTGIVAYNPGATATAITITPYRADGLQLSGTQDAIPARGKYIGVVSGLGLPAETAWLEITAASPITGFELFGTNNGNQLAGYTGVGISRTEGVFAKLEDDGWTGIAFVNIEDSTATVTLTAYNDNGAEVATQVMNVAANAKVVDLPENIFTQNISTATYIGFSSDRDVVGFQLNGSTDDMLLDGLPGL
ncbi:MAG: DNRLRE domain-containing protein [Deltaproteobacteria bacterium]|nr:DNRLRE domain-containing protein [Deltaproteobacteria bacterium]